MNVTARLHIITYLPSLAVRQKDLVMFNMELDVQMEGGFNIWESFIKVPWNMWRFNVIYFGRNYFKYFAVFFNICHPEVHLE